MLAPRQVTFQRTYRDGDLLHTAPEWDSEIVSAVAPKTAVVHIKRASVMHPRVGDVDHFTDPVRV
ncbi:MAG TPA: hypothetical protein VGQ44_15785 [Gemmatimonadaceae bacterium]|jgi:hypothetical protein|nr:hypothetical protein [Gemmatimonadaceae bacterium]